jgi:uncharacterized protein YbjT (DUF2867 family)
MAPAAKRPATIAVLGGTGVVGQPVVRRLVEDGFTGRLLVRGVDRAPQSLGVGIEYLAGD